MYSLVRLYLKTAVGFLVIGLVLGGWMMIRRELLGRYPTPYEISAHTHAILVGFVMLMIQGVALWLFPRPERGDERYRPVLAALAYWFVTLGTGSRVAGELIRASVPGSDWFRWPVVVAGLVQGAGIALFFHTMWSRIRPVGSQAREAKGERF
jgi:heme/copper-type cytochrome/quinol oxidase subunit 1